MTDCRRSKKAHVEVVLDPGVRSLPVPHAGVAVRVPTREVLTSHAAGLKVSLRREIFGHARQNLLG